MLVGYVGRRSSRNDFEPATYDTYSVSAEDRWMPSPVTAEGSGGVARSRAGHPAQVILSCTARPDQGWRCRPVRLAPGRFAVSGDYATHEVLLHNSASR